jgi:hypothetical protein
MVRKLRARGAFTNLEELKKTGHVEVLFPEARGRGNSGEKFPSDSAGPQQDRLRATERTLDDVIKSLQNLRNEIPQVVTP